MKMANVCPTESTLFSRTTFGRNLHRAPRGCVSSITRNSCQPVRSNYSRKCWESARPQTCHTSVAIAAKGEQALWPSCYFLVGFGMMKCSMRTSSSFKCKLCAFRFFQTFYSRSTDLTICYSNDNTHHSWNFSVDTWRTSRSVWIRR